MNDAITSFTKQNSFLSNFYGCDVLAPDGLMYPSVEHAFQAAKTSDIKIKHAFQVCPTAAEVKREGRRIQLVEHWDSNRIGIMYMLVKDKFTRNEELKAKLIATGDAYLEEGNYHGDTFWGTVKGNGQNNLGKILMKVRGEIIAESVSV